MSLCVIGFDAYFLYNPTQCFFSNDCSAYTYNGYYSNDYGLSNTDNLYNIKVPLTKGQLAAGVLMFVSSIIYIIIYAITSYQVRKNSQFGNGPSVPVVIMPTSSQYVPPVIIPTPMKQSSVNHSVESDTNSMPVRIPLICHNCKSKFQVSTQINWE
jgi:hypothetical protein